MSNRLIAYRVPPNREHLVQRELREAGIKAYVPRDRSRKRSPFTKVHPTDTVGWVFPERAYNAAFRRHAMVERGTVAREEIGRLYQNRPALPVKARPFALNDRVRTVVGWVGTVIEDRGRVFRVQEEQSGRILTVHETSMIRIDPG